jgi:DNA-binding YbaB/EbfC family protein
MEFEGTAAGGAVKVTMTGDLEVTSVTIDPEAVDPDDITMTEDLLVVAFNDVLAKYNQGSMQQLENLDLGGLSSMLGL